LGKYMEKLGSKVRRLQVVTAAEKQARAIFYQKSKGRSRPPRFEMLTHR
jgi:hypothetical protein